MWSKSAKQGIVWALTLIFLAIFLSFLFRNDTWKLLSQLGFTSAIVLISIALLYLLESVLAIKVLLQGMGYNVPYKNLYLVLTASMPANYTTPTKLGIPIRILLYKRFLAIPYSVGTASIALETVIGLGITLIIAFIGAFHLLQAYVLGIQLLLVFMLLVVITLLLIKFVGVFFFLRDRVSGKLFQRFAGFWIAFKESIKATSFSALCGVVLLLFIRIFVRVIVTYVILGIFSYQISILELLYIQSIAGIISMISMLPMGLGAQELSIVALLTSVGIPPDAGALIALIERGMWTLVPFVLGLISANRLGLQWVGEVSESQESSYPA